MAIRTFEELALSAPDLIGSIATWITSNAPRPQPALSLAAALSILSIFKAHRFRTPTNLRTNIYLCGIAPSGGGKNWPLEAVKQIAVATKADCLLSNKPVSDAGLLSSVKENNGKRLLLWDEFGDGINSLTKNETGFQRNIIEVMKELFSSAGSSYLARGYSDGNYSHKPQTINQPHLSVLAMSTPERLYNAISSKFIEDGFITRILFVQPTTPESRPRMVEQSPVPGGIVSRIEAIKARPINAEITHGNLEQYLQIKPFVVQLDSHAAEEAEASQHVFDEWRREYSTEGDVYQALWARAYEHMLKIALTIEPRDVITVESARWAYEFVCNCIDGTIRMLSIHGGDSNVEKSQKKLLSIIDTYPEGIPTRELTRATRSLKDSERAEALRFLVEAEYVEAVQVKTNGRTKKVYRCRA